MNQKVLKKLLKIDYELIQNKIGKFLNNEITNGKFNGVVFGLSGGIDSTVMAMLCAKFVREKSLAIIMPNGKITPKKDTDDAMMIVKNLKIEYKLIDIENIHKMYSDYLEPDTLAFGNLGARIRANVLYYYANVRKYLVLGSSDKSEFLIGYFTKFGDGAADLLPIVSLYKTQIRELAKYLKVSSNILSKPSGPHLWKGHTAEIELGIPYNEIDSILHCLTDKNLTIKETSEILEIPISSIEKIYIMYKNSKHKRITAKACKI